jgi:hypothetical protein
MRFSRTIRTYCLSRRCFGRVPARSLVLLLAVLTAGAVAARAQDEVPIQTELLALRRLMPDVGAGLRGVGRGSDGKYYVLTAPGAAVLIYDAAGKRVGQVPANPAGAAAIVYGESLSVDADGRVAVADRGAGGVKIYAPDGSLSAFVRVDSPESVAFFESSEGSELAVASVSSKRLVSVYDVSGRLVRDFGEPDDVVDTAQQPMQPPVPPQQAGMGLVGTDAASNVYFVFDYLPEVTVLKYDHLGYAVFNISAEIPEIGPPPPSPGQAAWEQAERNEIAREKAGGALAPHRVVTGMGVDPQNQELWVSVGTLLLHFDKDGKRLASYRTYTPSGGRLEATTILVEADRLLLGADPFGLYEFERPDKAKH